jgi:hypothetical protein
MQPIEGQRLGGERKTTNNQKKNDSETHTIYHSEVVWCLFMISNSISYRHFFHTGSCGSSSSIGGQ